MCFLIAYHTQTIYKSIHIENIFRILVLHQAKFTWKSDVSFWVCSVYIKIWDVAIKKKYWPHYGPLTRESHPTYSHCGSSQCTYKIKPEDHWSCIAHLTVDDMLKWAVIEEKKFKHSPMVGADNPLGPTFLCPQEGPFTMVICCV